MESAVASWDSRYGEVMSEVISVREKFPNEADGLLGVDLRAEGDVGPGQVPVLRGNVTLAQGQMTYQGEEVAEGLSAELALEDNRSVRTRLRGSALGGPLALDGTLAVPSTVTQSVMLTLDDRISLARTTLEFLKSLG